MDNFKQLIKEALTPDFLKEDTMPSQGEVNSFFEHTWDDIHYLNSKPVGEWDEYDLSNWESKKRKRINEEEIRHEGQSCEEAHPGLTHEEWEFEQEKKGSPKFWQKMWRVQKEDNTVDEYGIPSIKSNPKRHAASELLTFLDWPTSFYETVLKVKEEEDQLKMMKRLQEVQWLTEEIKTELEKKELSNNKDLADAFVTYVEENPFGEEKEEHSLDWYTQAIETTLQMDEPTGSIALMDDLIDHLSMLFSIIQEFPKKEERKIGFQFSKDRT